MSMIEEIQVIPLRCPLAGRHSIVGSAGEFRCCFIRVVTADGLTGLGEVQQGQRVPHLVRLMVDEVKGQVLGESPWSRARLWQKMYQSIYSWGRRGLPVGVIGAIDLALWDICGKEAGRPVYDLLGGPVRKRVPVYASGGLEQSVESMVGEAKSYVEEGYQAVKVRLLQQSSQANFELAQAVKEAVGPRVRLMLDACQQWKEKKWPVAEAIEVGRALEPLSPFWLEDPYDVNDLAGLVCVKKNVRIPIAVGETFNTSCEYLSCLMLAAADFIQTDVTVNGGLAQALRIAGAAAGYGLPVATHVWGTAVSLAANLHFAACTQNLAYVERPGVENPLGEALFVEKPRLVEGQLELPATPGLGVELDDETIGRYSLTGSSKEE